MINYKDEKDLQRVLSEFELPELVFVGRKDAGPDEELYFFKDEEGKEYGLWSRDYMSELKYEANGLKNDHDIEVEKWIKLKKPDIDEYVTEFEGDKYALFAVKQ
ncbi:hypothetical protein IKF02_00380 [Candidatus Saccharibacteria bacterium]|nr:hypothetical protein [Candidatus Saccharibacteria bacterium]